MSRYPFTVFGMEIQNKDDLDCLGLHLAPNPNDPWTNLVQDLPAACFPPPKRARRVSMRQIEKETGRVVTAVTVAPDGTRTFALGEKASAESFANPWDQIYETEQKRPS